MTSDVHMDTLHALAALNDALVLAAETVAAHRNRLITEHGFNETAAEMMSVHVHHLILDFMSPQPATPPNGRRRAR